MSDRFTVVGSLGADPERRTTKKGDPYVTFSIASNERRQDADGRWVDSGTSWFDVTAFGALARHSGDALHRGDRVIVLGDLTVAQYTTANGGTGRAVKIRATAVGHDLTVGGARGQRGQSAEPRSSNWHREESDESSEPSEPSLRAAPAASQVDRSGEWAPVAVGGAEQHDAAAEPEWMSTPF